MATSMLQAKPMWSISCMTIDSMIAYAGLPKSWIDHIAQR